VAQHLVDDDLEAKGVGALDQGVEILERAEDAVDVHVIGNVVAHVVLRALEDRRQPDSVDAEACDVVEPPHDAWQITDTVAVGVLKGARIDLIDHSAAPPLRIRTSKMLVRW
jgi:hypothetical protein